MATTEPEKAEAVLRIIEDVRKDCKEDEWEELLDEWVVIPTDDGELISPSKAVFAPEGMPLPDGKQPVAKHLAENPESHRILSKTLGVKDLDDGLWTQALRHLLPYYGNAIEWTRFWEELRKAPESVRNELISEKQGYIRVRRQDGEWAHTDEALLPGKIVNQHDSETNRNVLVDPAMHGKDTDMLIALGVTDSPQGISDPQRYWMHSRHSSCINDWLTTSRVRYEKSEDIGFTKPQKSKINPEAFSLPNGWKLLRLLSQGAAATLTSRMLKYLDNGDIPGTVVFRHSTKENEYPKVNMPHPLLVILWDYGVLQIGTDYVSLRAVVARCQDISLPEVSHHEKALSAIKSLEQGYVECARLSAFWHALIKVRATPDALSNDSLHDFWCAAAKDRIVPRSLNSHQGKISITDVYVTTSPDLAKHGRKAGNVVVTLDEKAIGLWLEKGACDLSKSLEPTWEENGPVVLLTSAIPDVSNALTEEAAESAECLPVIGLKLRINDHSDEVPCLMWHTQLLVDQSQLSRLSRGKRLQLVIDEISGAGWLEHSAGDALKDLGDSKVDEFRAKVAAETTLPERLLRAVGMRDEPLRQALGTIGTMDFLGSCTPIELAELVLAHHGVAVLSVLKATLEEEGLKPPSRWNTPEARTLTNAIGFPEEYAGASTSRREPEEYITGPIILPPLHDFQQVVLQNIEALLFDQATRRRAVVSLPTGGGKTRVTVEAAVRYVLEPERKQRYVLWIAQTDELCEQAVQAFRQVWLNLGASNTELRIVRLWGGNPDPTVQDDGKPLVVVASIQTLNARTTSSNVFRYGKPGLLVVDECHHAITPSYTDILRAVTTQKVTEKNIATEPPIIGLSATPFRINDEESERLAKRFDGRWFPKNQKRLHEELRRQGVLAETEMEPLTSGVALTEDEIDRFAQLKDSKESILFERLVEQINQRLAGNQKRNVTMIECIKQSQERSILFFANSVDHAHEMAVRFNFERLPAAAISGETPPSVRRNFLDRFQRGQIKVLCNHTVLTTGFDAPKIDMIMISRQVFSPVRYMQMVGRGLRGIKNGGTPRCKIVTGCEGSVLQITNSGIPHD